MARRRRRSSAQLPLFAEELFTAADESSVAEPTATAARAMVWLRAQGESIAAIARQFHTSRATVLRYTRDPMRIRQLEEDEDQARRG